MGETVGQTVPRGGLGHHSWDASSEVAWGWLEPPNVICSPLCFLFLFAGLADWLEPPPEFSPCRQAGRADFAQGNLLACRWGVLKPPMVVFLMCAFFSPGAAY